MCWWNFVLRNLCKRTHATYLKRTTKPGFSSKNRSSPSHSYTFRVTYEVGCARYHRCQPVCGRSKRVRGVAVWWSICMQRTCTEKHIHQTQYSSVSHRTTHKTRGIHVHIHLPRVLAVGLQWSSVGCYVWPLLRSADIRSFRCYERVVHSYLQLPPQSTPKPRKGLKRRTMYCSGSVL